MKILVTGANGQLGCELRALASSAPEYHFVFTSRAELDITDTAATSRFIQEQQVRVIINCAARPQADRAEANAEMTHRLNHVAVENLARTAASSNALLIHISSDYIFGNQWNKPITEQDTPDPLGVYGRTKVAGEEAIRTSGCRHIILRTSWLYSVYGENFVKTMRRLMQERDDLNVVYDQVGSPTYAKDLAMTILAILRSPHLERSYGTYHYSNEGVCSWYDFAMAIRHFSGMEAACHIHPCRSWEFPTKAPRPPFSVLDKSAIKNAFGIEIPYWVDSLRECLATMDSLCPCDNLAHKS